MYANEKVSVLETYLIQVVPVSADGVQHPQEQVDLQRGVLKGDVLWGL